MPWRDRDGRISLLKLSVFLALFLPGLWTLSAWLTDDLGPEPLRATMKEIGQDALYLLLLSLLVTPARQVLRTPGLTTIRRMVGIGALAYALLHFTLYIADQNGNLPRIATEIGLRFYLTIGFVALLGLIALGVTSTDGMISRMGGSAWRRLHRLAYPIALLATLHFILHAKSNVTGPMVAAGLYLWLMGYRLTAPRGSAPNTATLAGLALGAAMVTAALEFAWYALATGIDPWRVFAANIDPDLMPRPAGWVLIAGVAVVLARLFRSPPRARRAAIAGS